MRITWGLVAETELGFIPQGEADQIRSEVETAFLDSIPPNTWNLPYDRLITELPCGREMEFDRVGDGVRILHLRPQQEGRVAVQDGARTVRHHGA